MVFRGEQREDQSSPAEYKKGLQRDDWHRGIVGNLLLVTYSQSGCIVCDRTLVEICCKRLCTFLSSDQNRHLSRVIIQTG